MNGILCEWRHSTVLSGTSSKNVTRKPASNDYRVAIVLAFSSYCLTARTVWRKRKELPGFLNPLNEDPFKSTVTTEIDVVSRPRRNSSPLSVRAEDVTLGSASAPPGDNYDPYSVNVEVGPQDIKRRPSMPTDLMRIRTLTRTAAEHELNAEAWLYARTSFLFFLALLITWVSLFKSNLPPRR